jgi:deazaflavin-dependent oxidoreductase (nitroreductase family)
MIDAAGIKDFNRTVIEEFRAPQGQVGGGFAGAPVLLLTTTGAKTGRRHTTPLVYLADGERWAVIASMGGAPKHPAWYHNVVANPRVTVEVGAEAFEATATVAPEPERTRLFRAQAELRPNFADYEQKTTRVIPVVVLER